MKEYNHKKIDKKWQDIWEKSGIYQAKQVSKKPKWYSLIEFPYPSGAGLHTGHIRSNTAMDIISRKRRMQGYNVLYPIGWDAFGLPAENYAIKNKVSPQKATRENIKTFKKQLKSLGYSFDWSREVNTTDPEYYKWTQWIFLKLLEAGLAYKGRANINWCINCKIGLANEEVVAGKCERCGGPVELREKEQWMLKITAYAEKLLKGLDEVDFLPDIKAQQRNWIGKSEGVEFDFLVQSTSVDSDILLLHGYKGDSNRAQWLIKELKSLGVKKVTALDLPGGDKPEVIEQIEFVKKNYNFTSKTIIVTHSLSGPLCLKLLPTISTKIDKLIMIAPPLKVEFKDKKARPDLIKFCDWKFNWKKVIEKANSIIVVQDKMDSIVPASHTIEIAKNLKATLISKEAKVPHFNGKEEPVILETLIPRIKTFTTRPDTIQAVTCLVLAPEHELINLLQDKITNLEQVRKYQKQASAKTDIERSAEGEEKTGVKLQGVEVVNPYNNEKIPVYIADYVLAEYGTGAVMAVPAYDSRDAEFSKNLGIPFSNADLVSASEAVKKAKGKKTVKYKLRDWVFSRQRYWGEPIPVVNCNSCGYVPVPKKDLPVTLPKVKKYLPRDDGKSPLASITSWVNTTCPKCKGSAQRETDVMPNWAGSSWYFLRYTDPKNVKEFASEKSLKAFTPVDWYNGGMEHVTLHLLYSRFWNLFLFDQGLVPFKEPYKKRTKHGMILAEGGVKMSKSKENTISPDEITKEFGADSLRVYEMFMGPFDQAIAWEKRGILGPARFLEKVYKISQEKIVKKTSDSKELLKLIHKTIKKVSDDIESMSFNTAISSLMVLVNQMSEEKEVSEKTWKLFLLILAPFAPHITEELWLEKKSIHIQPWPTHDEALAKDETFELVIQVNSKLRGKVQVDKGISKQKAEELARSNEQAKKWLEGKEVKRVIFIKDRLINLIV